MTEEQPTPRKRRGCRRFLALGLLLSLGAAAVSAGLLYTGQPQRLGAQYLLSTQLGARAEVTSVSLKNPLAVQGLSLAGRADSLYGPVLTVGHASVAYALRPDNNRHIGDVALSGIRLSLQQGVAENNFQFLLDRFAQPGGGGGDMTPWVPERVRVEDLWVELNFPSYYLRMDNLGFQAALAGAAEGSLAFDAPEIGIAWSSVYTPGGAQSGAGSVRFDANWNGADIDVDAAIDLGALARIRGTASMMHRDGQPFYALSLPEASLEDPLWSAMLTDLSPIPMRFDRLTLSESEIHIHQEAGRTVVDQATVDARIPALSIGPEDAPFYTGPLQIAVRGNYGGETTITGAITLLEDTRLEGDFQWTQAGLAGTFAWAPWTRDALAKLTPPDYAGALDLLKPLARLGATGTLTQTPGAMHIEGALSGDFGSDQSLEVPLAVAIATQEGARTITITSDVALHGGKVHSIVTVPPDAPVTVDNTLADVELNRWTTVLLGNELIPWFSGAISGSARVAMPPGQPLGLDLDLTGQSLRYGDIVLPPDAPVKMAGRLSYDLATGKLASRDAHLAQDGVIDLTTKGWTLDLNKSTMDLALESTLSLDAVAALFGLSDLYGNATLQGQLRVGPETTKLEGFAASSDDLGYGDYSVPYGSALNLAGSLAYARSPNTLRLEPFEAAIGEGTRLSTGALELRFPSDQAAFAMRATPLTLQSDLDILVQRGLLQSVTGAALTVRSDDFAWNGETYDGVLAWDIAAERLEFPDDMANLEQIAWSGRYNPGDAEDGGGPLTASAFSIYKVPFGAADTTLKVTPEHVICDALETAFLGGSLLLSGRIDYHDPTFPTVVKVTATKLDLEEFTRTFEPPDVVLTGQVSGTADLALTAEGLQDLHVDLTASENLTLNRSMVRQILMSQYVNDAVGSKSVQKVIEKVIGNDDQRPFEKAVLQLRLEGGLIRGIARLESKSLDVTVDINAEPEAILEAIRSTAENR